MSAKHHAIRGTGSHGLLPRCRTTVHGQTRGLLHGVSQPILQLLGVRRPQVLCQLLLPQARSHDQSADLMNHANMMLVLMMDGLLSPKSRSSLARILLNRAPSAQAKEI